ncbi:MAG: hypothetical protein JG718_11490 [Candidatus Thiothrix moscowensis]|nr:hypothetical protein [Candidatus Thiothrix moscowensis]
MALRTPFYGDADVQPTGRALQYHFFPLTVQEVGNDFVLERALRYGMLP